MAFLAISDLHITGADDPLFHSLLDLVRKRTGAGDILVLAGDIFDLFVGNKRLFLERYQELLDALAEAGRRGVEVHYIEGNHDFLIHRAFRRVPGLLVHSCQVQLEVEGRRFHVEHGDTVDREDYGYRALRTFFRSPVMRAFVTLAPGSWLQSLGDRSSRKSRERQGNLRLLADHRPERVERLRRIYRNYAADRLAHGADFVVMGHCHDLDELGFIIGGRQGQYINIGYPRAHGTYVAWNPGDPAIRRVPLP